MWAIYVAVLPPSLMVFSSQNWNCSHIPVGTSHKAQCDLMPSLKRFLVSRIFTWKEKHLSLCGWKVTVLKILKFSPNLPLCWVYLLSDRYEYSLAYKRFRGCPVPPCRSVRKVKTNILYAKEVERCSLSTKQRGTPTICHDCTTSDGIPFNRHWDLSVRELSEHFCNQL